MLFFPPTADLTDPPLGGMEAAGLLLGGPLMPIRPSAIELEQQQQQQQQAHSLHQLFMMEQQLQQQQHDFSGGGGPILLNSPPFAGTHQQLLPPMFPPMMGFQLTAEELQQKFINKEQSAIIGNPLLLDQSLVSQYQQEQQQQKQPCQKVANLLAQQQQQPAAVPPPLLLPPLPGAAPPLQAAGGGDESAKPQATSAAEENSNNRQLLLINSGEHQQQQTESASEGGKTASAGGTHQMAMPPTGPCGLCRLPIVDKAFLLIDAQSWHLDCVRCAVCGQNLEHLGLTCFARDGFLFCRRDYLMKFGRRCERCAMPIERGELVMRVPPRCASAEAAIFHVQCFTCCCCGQALNPGERYTTGPQEQPGGALFCRAHFHLNPSNLPAPQFPQFQPVNCCPGGGGEEPRFLVELNPSTTIGGGGNGPSCLLQSQQSEDHQPQQQQLLMAAGSRQSPSPGGGGGPFLHHHQLEADNKENPAALMMADFRDVDSPNGGGLSGTEDFGGCSGCPNSNSGSSGPNGHQNKQKRMRTSFKHHQLRTMKSYFSLNHNPDAKDLKQLAQKTGLTKRVLQVWFQNARAKYRRNQQHKMGSLGGGGSMLDHPGAHHQHLLMPMAAAHSAVYQPNMPLDTLGGTTTAALALTNTGDALPPSSSLSAIHAHQPPSTVEGAIKGNSQSPVGCSSSAGDGCGSSASVSLNAGGSSADEQSSENSYQ